MGDLCTARDEDLCATRPRSEQKTLGLLVSCSLLGWLLGWLVAWLVSTISTFWLGASRNAKLVLVLQYSYKRSAEIALFKEELENLKNQVG